MIVHNDTGWYRHEVKKVIEIIKESTDNDVFVSREYMLEKLERIYLEIGIGVHMTLEGHIRNVMAKENADCIHNWESCWVDSVACGHRCTICGTQQRDTWQGD
jgi:hypothetical protein